MKPLGKKLFTGAAIGGGVGAVAGGITGGIIANQKIEALPTDTVELGSFKKPMFEEKVMGRDTNINLDFEGGGYNGVSSHSVTAKFPVRNPDGTLHMQEVPGRTVTGHGKAMVTERLHEIREPVGTEKSTYAGDNFGDGINVNSHTRVKYKNVGYWKEPVVKFETGVSRAGHILGYAAAGLAAGATGGALVALALDKIT
ncbi:MAG: hypothetical protein ACLFQV_13800 [Vulcanimicrobiota bacterium]